MINREEALNHQPYIWAECPAIGCEESLELYNREAFIDLINNIYDGVDILKNRSCENCKYCNQFAELGLCDIQRGYVNMKLLKYCGNWESK